MADLLTGPQKALLRENGQFALVYLGGDIGAPTVVFACQINNDYETHDMKAATIFNNVTVGAYTDVLPDMTMLVGTAPGLSDVGICRIRKAPTSAVIYHNETSEIAFTNHLYLTVIEDFDLWRKDLRIINKVAYMDYEITYSDQHTNCDPVPVFGEDACIFRPDITIDATNFVTCTAFNASPSWVSGSSISARAFSVTPSSGVTITGGTTNTPSIKLTAAGKYRVSCLLTAANGKTFMGHRYIYVYDKTHMPLTAFVMESPTGSFDSGGWSFRLKMYAEAADIRERAKVFILARDFYGGVEGGVGTNPGRENIEAIGRIAEDETITIDPEQGDVTFDVRGPNYWLAQIPCFPTGVQNTAGAATAWTNFHNLTVDKGLFHLLHWRTTATRMMDVTLSGDSRILAETSAPASNLWAQITEMATSTILAKPLCDHYGALWIQIDTQFMPTADRSSIPVVMTLTKADLAKGYQLTRHIVPRVSQNNLSGVIVNNGLIGAAVFSLANGHVPKRYGRVVPYDRLLLSSQLQANVLASAILEHENNPFGPISPTLAANNRAFDIAPRQFASFEIDADDNVRGVSFSGHLIPRSITYSHDPATGTVTPVIDFETETFPNSLYTNGDIPNQTPPPSYPAIPPISIPQPAPVAVLPYPSTFPISYAVLLDDTLGLWYCADVHAVSPQWFSLNMGLTDADMGNLERFAVQKYGGSPVVHAISAVAYYYGRIGAGMSLRYDSDWLVSLLGSAPMSFTDLTVNPYSGFVAVLAGIEWALSHTKYIFFGVGGSLTKKSYALGSPAAGGRMSYGSSGDLYITFFAGNPLIPTATITKDNGNAFSEGDWSQTTFHTRGGGTQNVTGWYLAGATIYNSTDGGRTNASTAFPGTTPYPINGVAIDPTGMYQMVVDDTATARRTSDGGVTWGDIPYTFVHARQVLHVLGFNSWMIVQKDGGVFITDDFGDTWLDVTGNLRTFLPAATIIQAEVILP